MEVDMNSTEAAVLIAFAGFPLLVAAVIAGWRKKK